MGTQEGGWLSFLTSSGTYREDAFDRDLLLITAFYYDHGYINVKLGKPEIELVRRQAVPLHHHPHRRRADRTRSARSTSTAICCCPRTSTSSACSVRAGETFNRSKLGNDITEPQRPLQGRRLRLRQRAAADRDRRRRRAPSTSSSTCRRATRSTSGASTSAATPRRATRSSAARCASTRASSTTRRASIARSGWCRRSASSRRSSCRPRRRRADPTRSTSTSRSPSAPPARSRSAPASRRWRTSSARRRCRRTTCSAAARRCSCRRRSRRCASCSRCAISTPTSSTRALTFAFSIYNSLLFYPSFNRTARGGDLTWGYLFGDYTRVFGTYKLEYVDVQQNQAGLTIGGFGTVDAGLAGHRRQPVPLRLHLVGAPVDELRHARRSHVPQAAACSTRSPSRSPIR